MQTIDVHATQTDNVRKATRAAPFGYYKPGVPRQIPVEAETGEKVMFLAEYIERVYNLALLKRHISDREIADYFNTTPEMVQTWKQQYPEFRDAIKEGGLEADAKVARALFDRAKGTTYKTNEVVKVKEDRYTERVEIVEVEKTIPADITAAQTWLKNRAEGWAKDNPVIALPQQKTDSEDAARRIAFLFAKAEAAGVPLTVHIDNRHQSVTIASPPKEGE